MRKYILFLAESATTEQYHQMKLQHTQALTDILTEYWDSSDRPIPEPGYRPTEFVRVEAEHDAEFHGWSTHYKTGDWEVVRVHTYTPDIPAPYGGEFDTIVMCYCRYNPIEAPLKPMPERQVSLESFGGDQEAYQQWLEDPKNSRSTSMS